MERILDAQLRNETHCVSQNGCFITGSDRAGYSGCLFPQEIHSTWCRDTNSFENTEKGKSEIHDKGV